MYDPKCEELARHFLSDVGREDLSAKLAQHIQTEIENWLEWQATCMPVPVESH